MDAPAGEADEAAWVALGSRLMVAKGCLNCHTVDTNKAMPVTFAAMTANGPHDHGCLADTADPMGKVPWYRLTAEERSSLRAFLKNGITGAGSPAPSHAVRVAMRRFNCLNCHQRDGEGGLAPELLERLRKFEKAENAEEIAPPSLTGVGHKLLTPWLKGLFTQAQRARPWLALRMPQYGEANVGFLAEALSTVEGAEPDATPHAEAFSTAKAEAGRALTGKGGFGCISCHDFAGVANSGTRGPDLTIAAQRLRYDWFRNWLEQPQRMQPGTRMPQVFTGGKSQLANYFDGSADKQAAALWAYWSLGPNLALPDGLEPPKGRVLTVKDRPELLRTFMPDAGSKALAVGYPGGVSVAFDAATCRMAYAWAGNFLDVSPVWDGRGGAPAKPLGPRFWTAPAGHPWAVTDGPTPPDFAAQAKDSAYGAAVAEGTVYVGPRRVRFDGYEFDSAGSPTFRYHTDAETNAALSVRERAEPLRSPLAPGVARKFQVELPAKHMAWLLAGESEQPPRVYTADGTSRPLTASGADLDVVRRVVVLTGEGGRSMALAVAAAPEHARWRIVHDGSGWKALLRLDGGSPAALHLNVWGLPREEPTLLKELMKTR
jgi:cytochrome c551/c552